jgi:gamma-glutamylcyclotransferase (GGCT)/AIG2-like uncharacterized protein YtfP
MPYRPMLEPSGAFLYFAYGSNLDAERLGLRCPSARFLMTARLPHHTLAFTRFSEVWRGGVADVRFAVGEEVWGALWLIDGKEGDALDKQEGVHHTPPAYRRYRVTVETPAGDDVVCRSYQVAQPAAHDIAPSPRYLATMVMGARACGLPTDYVARLAEFHDNGDREAGGPWALEHTS